MDLHCKVAFRDELRRFPMNGVGFLELQKIIQTLFGLEKEFTLQYRDNENDLVVLSSNEELACALTCINSNILQIVVQDPTPPTMDYDQRPHFPHPFSPPFHPHWGHFRNHHGGPPPHFPPPFHRHCHFGKDQSRRCNRIGLKKEILSRKLKEVESTVMELSGQEESTFGPNQQRRISALQKKKRCLEHRLSKIDERTNHLSGKKSEKCFKKRAKHEKKYMKKMGQHGKFLIDNPFLLSDVPNNSELGTLHAKFQSLKPELEEIKIQLKASKAALKEAEERGESTDQWLHEVAQLKEAKKAKKQQIVPLGIQIRDMHAQRVH